MYRIQKLFGVVQTFHPEIDKDGVHTVTITVPDPAQVPSSPPEETVWSGSRIRDARRLKLADRLHEQLSDDFAVYVVHIMEKQVGGDWIPQVHESIMLNPAESKGDVVISCVTRWEPLEEEGWVDIVNIGGYKEYEYFG